MNREIERVTLAAHVDESPDLSWIGAYSDKPGPAAKTKICHDGSDRRTFRYFISANAENRAHAHEDWRRMEAYNRGDWWMVGVYATATIRLTDERGTSHTQTLRSPGIWGIESDSDPSFLNETGREEWTMLKADLSALGFTDAELDAVDPGEVQS